MCLDMSDTATVYWNSSKNEDWFSKNQMFLLHCVLEEAILVFKWMCIIFLVTHILK